MLILLSPAKKLNLNHNIKSKKVTLPDFFHETKLLINILKQQPVAELKKLMQISNNIAELNYTRYQNFSLDNDTNLYDAIYSFAGEVYQGLAATSFSETDLEYASENLRILSGLYGILKPFDQIQPYRLEMGTKLANEKGKNLYDFWQEKLTQKVNQAKGDVIINLASQEYFKVLNHKQLNKNIITPLFYDYKNGQYKAIMMYTKKARGMMARYIIKNKITQWEQIKFFNYENYIFNEELSNFDCKNKKIVFTRS